MSTREENEAKYFLFATLEDQASSDRMRELTAEAAASGRMLVRSPKKSHDQEVLDDAERHRANLPSIARNDHRAFLKNLDKVARGDMIVAQS